MGVCLNCRPQQLRNAARVKSPQKRLGLPLDYVAEVAFELHLMRGECSDAARRLLADCPLDEVAVQECALLDEALRHAHRILNAAVSQIRRQRTAQGPLD